MAGASEWRDWVGRERVTADTLMLERARKLAATLDDDPVGLRKGDALPLGWHWIYFHEPTRRSDLGEEGHERRGDFLPPVPLSRRMWAGGRLRFTGTLRIGEPVRRTSTIRSIERKDGRSGPLVFVTVGHRVEDTSGAAVEEEQDIVYLDRPETTGLRGVADEPRKVADEPRKVADEPRRVADEPREVADESREAEWTEHFAADEVVLFRFSALTFNGHRIHFDRRYATEVEKYPDIVVHGPLLALLLLREGLRGIEAVSGAIAPDASVDFRYRALQPVFCNELIELSGRASSGLEVGRGMDLWAAAATRGLATRAELVVRE